MRTALALACLLAAALVAGCSAFPAPAGGDAARPCPEGSVPWNGNATPDQYGHDVDPGHPGGRDPNGNGRPAPACVR